MHILAMMIIPMIIPTIAGGAVVPMDVAPQPRVTVVVPRWAPLAGGTRVMIFGDDFQMPVQVFFDEVEARVLSVDDHSITAIAPPARHAGAATVRVKNGLGVSGELALAFYYRNPAVVHAVHPDRGSATGGTLIFIDGEGFIAPLSVMVGNVPAQILTVSGTRITTLTHPLASACDALVGAITIEDLFVGSVAYGPAFTYEPSAQVPVITDKRGTVTIPGEVMDVTLAREGNVQFFASGLPLEVVAQEGPTYRLRIPQAFRFGVAPCMTDGIAGIRPQAIAIDLRVVDRDTSCTITDAGAIHLLPTRPAICTLPPHALVSEACLRIRRGASSGTITIANRETRGTADLEITGVTVSGPFRIDAQTATVAAGANARFAVTFEPNGDENDGVSSGMATFTTNDPDQPFVRVCLTAYSRVRH